MPINFINSPEVFERVRRLDVPFNRYGLDPYGVSQAHLANVFTLVRPFYDSYFSVECIGFDHIPPVGQSGMLVGNHSGGVPVDAAMLFSAGFFELEPPRLIHGMVDKFANRWPVVSNWFNRIGQFTGLPEHAVRLMRDRRLLMVFPEGTRGTGKLYKDRYELVRFGTGFMRLALKAETPIVPFAFIGGEEALPTIVHLKTVARMVGAPYIPVPPHLIPVPLPVRCEIHVGEPIEFDGDGSEADETIRGYIEEVKEEIRSLIERGREHRRRALEGASGDSGGRT